MTSIKLIKASLGAICISVVLGLTMTVPNAQTLPAQIQAFWNVLRTGGYAFNIVHVISGGYANFGTTTGTSGYGIHDSAGTMQAKNSGGAWVAIAPSGGSAPADATYITQTANAGLSNEQALASLSTGYMKVATTTGVVTSQPVPIPAADGGTGIATFVIGDLLSANSTTTLTRLADVAAGSVLVSGGVTTAPAYSSTPSLTSLTTTGGTNTLTFAGLAATVANTTVGASIISQNTTASDVGTVAQWSPPNVFLAHGWDVDDAVDRTARCYTVLRPISANTVTSQIQFMCDTSPFAGGGTTGFQQVLALTNQGQLTALGAIVAGTSSTFTISGKNNIASSANGLLNLTQNSGATVGVQINTGTTAPTVGTCGTGTIDSHATNTSGLVTPTGATACTITFGTPAWTNTPNCVVTAGSGLDIFRISAASTTAITVTFSVASTTFYYHCFAGSI